jgi:hypothetical protein
VQDCSSPSLSRLMALPKSTSWYSSCKVAPGMVDVSGTQGNVSWCGRDLSVPCKISILHGINQGERFRAQDRLQRFTGSTQVW